MADFMQSGDFQFILRVLNTNVDGRESEDKALLPLKPAGIAPRRLAAAGGTVAAVQGTQRGGAGSRLGDLEGSAGWTGRAGSWGVGPRPWLELALRLSTEGGPARRLGATALPSPSRVCLLCSLC